MATAVEINFPPVPLGVRNTVQTVAELRALDSTLVDAFTEVLVDGLGFFNFDPSSLAVDNGTTIIKPTDLTVLQAGRWLVALSGSAILTSYTPDSTPADQSTVAAKLDEGPIDPRANYGVVADGATNDAPAWGDVAAALVGFPREVRVPAGTSLIRAQIAFPEGTILQGQGKDVSIIHVKNAAAMASLYGLLMRSGMRVRDLTIRVDKNALTSCAALAFADGASDIIFERVRFEGVAKTAEWIGIIAGSDVSSVHFINCEAYNLDYGMVPLKDNSDTSTQDDWHWLGCRADDCTDSFSINSPAGIWRNGSMMQCRAEGSSQFAYAFAGPGCYNWMLNIVGYDNVLEMLHIEDAANRIQGRLQGELNNTAQGSYPSPNPPNSNPNGTIQIIGGSNGIDLEVNIDCTMNVGGSPNGVIVQAGGPRVSDGLTVDPFGIKIHGEILLKGGCTAVEAYECPDIDVTGLRVVNTDTADKAERMFYMPGTDFEGNIEAVNPGVVLETNNTTPGGFGGIRVSGDLTDMEWQIGIADDRTASDLFDECDRNQAFTVNAAADWQNILPTLENLRARFSFSYKGAAGNAYALGVIEIRNGILLDAPATARQDGTVVFASTLATTGDTTNNSPTLTNLASIAGVIIGAPVFGTGIPAGAYVTRIISTTSVEISALATATAVGVALTFDVTKTSSIFRINSGWIQAHAFRATTEIGTARLKLTSATAFGSA